MQNLNSVFNNSVAFLQNAPRTEDVRVLPEFQEDWSRLAVQNQALAFDASVLSTSFNNQASQVKQTNSLLIFTLLGAFGAYFVTVYFVIYRRTLTSIKKLHDGTKIIGSGNLDYAIASKQNDEIGELSEAFNQMAINLKTVTASKAELEQTQASLKESEQRWSTTLKSIGDAVIATDTTGNITFMNGLAEDLTGWVLSEAAQKPLQQVFHIINEKTRQEIQNPVDKVLEKGAVVGLADHSILIRKDNSETPIDDSGSPIRNQNGQVTGVVLVFHDITERKNAEDYSNYQRILQQSINKILEEALTTSTEEQLGKVCLRIAEQITQSKFGFIGEINEKGLETIVISNPGRDPSNIIVPGGQNNPPGNFKIHGLYGKVLTDSKGFFTNDLEHHPDSIGLPMGHPPLNNFLGTPLIRDGKTIGMIAMGNREGGFSDFDLSALEALAPSIVEAFSRKRAEKALENYSKNLEKMVEDKTKQLKDSERLAAIGATAGMVGHDIRNPLQAITSDVYLAETELASIPESEEKKNALESLSEIEKNIDYINKIVQDLQDYARPLNPRAEESNLKLIVEKLLAKNSLPKNVKVSVKVAEEVKTINADADDLNRILYNLVNNSVQAMPNGGKLTIQAHKEANDAVITVRDTGVGIPENIQNKMFTLMFTTKSKGQGFGLPVVKRMTESLGGTVNFESEVGKGTKFIIRLPTTQKDKQQTN